jgi:hypothetical protein
MMVMPILPGSSLPELFRQSQFFRHPFLNRVASRRWV